MALIMLLLNIKQKAGTTGENRMKQYIVDAFTNTPFAGNPAAVCVLEKWPSEESMMKLAMENNLSETAFILKEGNPHLIKATIDNKK